MTTPQIRRRMRDLLESSEKVRAKIGEVVQAAADEAGMPLWAAYGRDAKTERVLKFRRAAVPRLRDEIEIEERTRRLVVRGEPSVKFKTRPLSFPFVATVLGMKDHVSVMKMDTQHRRMGTSTAKDNLDANGVSEG